MPLKLWRLLESESSGVTHQMDLDRQLFGAFISDSQEIPLLRIYQVPGPSITIGRAFHQIGIETLQHERIPVCTRPTGGGLVRHGSDLIYSVIARKDTYPTFHQVRTSYLSIHEAIQQAFKNLGFPTELFRCDDPVAKKNIKASTSIDECFQKPVPTDLRWKDEKIAGGAQWRKREGFLHQGSIQLFDGVTFGYLKAALIQAFQEKFQIEWTDPVMVVDESNPAGYKRAL